jgi:hypothetical protein
MLAVVGLSEGYGLGQEFAAALAVIAITLTGDPVVKVECCFDALMSGKLVGRKRPIYKQGGVGSLTPDTAFRNPYFP